MSAVLFVVVVRLLPFFGHQTHIHARPTRAGRTRQGRAAAGRPSRARASAWSEA
jgi:hypothetical protein